MEHLIYHLESLSEMKNNNRNNSIELSDNQPKDMLLHHQPQHFPSLPSTEVNAFVPTRMNLPGIARATSTMPTNMNEFPRNNDIHVVSPPKTSSFYPLPTPTPLLSDSSSSSSLIQSLELQKLHQLQHHHQQQQQQQPQRRQQQQFPPVVANHPLKRSFDTFQQQQQPPRQPQNLTYAPSASYYYPHAPVSQPQLLQIPASPSLALQLQENKPLQDTINLIISKVSACDFINPDASSLSIVAMALYLPIPKLLSLIQYPTKDSVVYKDIRMNCIKFLKPLDQLCTLREQKLKLYVVFKAILDCTSQEKWDFLIQKIIYNFLMNRVKLLSETRTINEENPGFGSGGGGHNMTNEFLCKEIDISHFTMDSSFQKVFLFVNLTAKIKKPKHL
jgi:hypothetical protein